ncbi:hypothetical protein HEK616_82570 (plasmid) [Streptomyces nigrescens]|uniref:Uncharacterized protein n=2 Tax=Streptomyces TaxID=1883 RepID=A0ABM8A8C7_STRNI|nr:hypothetical protein [Streptomyces nigrescens]MEE4420532.1 hypothetical protein [Streptomyces sp. DSM 41528]BDM74770.1 hypothetical protein HEK616_82570 [Streptomyces nigrescens]
MREDGGDKLQLAGAQVVDRLEVSHHAMIQYRLPSTGEIVALLQIAPSKTDQERVLLVSPELADVPATIIRRVRPPPAPAPSRSCPPTITRSAPGTRRHPCSSSGTAAVKTPA